MRILHFNHIGKRKEQEDQLWISSDKRFFVVCDGVGSSEKGGLASKLVVEYLSQAYGNFNTNFEFDSVTLSDERLQTLILNANSYIKKSATKLELNESMSTTIALVYFDEDSATIAHIGDSRVYYIEKDGNWWKTKDHTYVQELFDMGLLRTEQEMKDHDDASIIKQALSNKTNNTELDISINKINSVKAGDKFLLLTDGALENYNSKEIVSLFWQTENCLDQKWSEFSQKCAAGSKDNSTSILIEL